MRRVLTGVLATAVLLAALLVIAFALRSADDTDWIDIALAEWDATYESQSPRCPDIGTGFDPEHPVLQPGTLPEYPTINRSDFSSDGLYNQARTAAFDDREEQVRALVEEAKVPFIICRGALEYRIEWDGNGAQWYLVEPGRFPLEVPRPSFSRR
jgi:hypothetical protein